ncbi:hypothetical protein [Flavobacterium pedocola]
MKVKNMNIYYILAIVCTVAAMVFSYLAAKKDGQETEDKLKQTITDQTKEIKTLNSKNIELAEKIIKQTNQITGEGSYPIATLGGGQDNGNQTQIVIGLKGEFAIPNLTAKFVVIPNYSEVDGMDFRIPGFGIDPINFGTLRPFEMQSILVETKTEETVVIIYFKSDNNSWTESIRIKKNDEGRHSICLSQDNEGQYVFKKIDPNFPKTDNGDIILWKNNSINISELQ